jgi:hypothetical protein
MKEQIVDSEVIITEQSSVEPVPTFQEVRAAELYCWRVDQLERAGYSGELAHSLAENHAVDLHAACSLLARGCSQQIAFSILS